MVTFRDDIYEIEVTMNHVTIFFEESKRRTNNIQIHLYKKFYSKNKVY